ncbi:MAG: TAXI family TRAP transporter solute-binding subunit, partial [Chloroflexota bacterium]
MAAKAAWQWPAKLTLVNYSPETATSNGSWGKLLAEDTGMAVDLPVEPDMVKRYMGVGEGLYDLVPGFSNETAQLLTSERDFNRQTPFTPGIVWAYSKSNSGFIVNGKVPIYEPHDINPGTKMVDASAFISMRFYHALLAWAQVDRADIEWVPAQNIEEVGELIASGKASVAFATPISKATRIAAAGPSGIHWINLNAEKDPAGAARFAEIYPLAQFGIVPEGADPSAAGTWGTESINYYLAAAPADGELVYRLAGWLDANYARFAPLHKDNRFRSRETLLKGLKHTFIPLHPGLIKYLKEKSLWSDSHEKREKRKLALVTGYRKAFDEALKAAKKQ